MQRIEQYNKFNWAKLQNKH